MQKRDTRPNQGLIIVWLLITGAGIGWLLGLAVSPVVSIVITSVTGAAAALVAVLSGLKDEPQATGQPEQTHTPKPSRLRWDVDPLPLTMLICGLWVGSIFGVWVRTHNWLSPAQPTYADEVQEWIRLGLPQTEVVHRLFESRFAVDTNASAVQTRQGATTQDSVLFAVAASDCAELKNKQGNDLRTEMLSAGSLLLTNTANAITDTVVLKILVEKVLCVGGPPSSQP